MGFVGLLRSRTIQSCIDFKKRLFPYSRCLHNIFMKLSLWLVSDFSISSIFIEVLQLVNLFLLMILLDHHLDIVLDFFKLVFDFDVDLNQIDCLIAIYFQLSLNYNKETKPSKNFFQIFMKRVFQFKVLQMIINQQKQMHLQFELQGCFFGKTAKYIISHIDNHVCVSSLCRSAHKIQEKSLIFSDRQIQEQSRKYIEANLAIYSVTETPYQLLFSKNEPQQPFTHQKLFPSYCTHKCQSYMLCQITPEDSLFISVDPNSSHKLSLINLEEDSSCCYQEKQIYCEFLRELELISVNCRSQALELVLFYTKDEEIENNLADGFMQIDIETATLVRRYQKSHRMLSKNHILKNDYLLINGQLNVEDNTSSLRMHDLRTSSETLIIDTCDSEYTPHPTWIPYHSHVYEWGQFEIGTVWGNGGLKNGQIVILDIRKPLHKYNYSHTFKHLRHIQKLQHSLWTVENIFQNYQFIGNKVSMFKFR